MRTLIVDDEPLARERIRTLLREEPDIELVGECADGHEAVSAIEEKRPELLFLDVQMPEMDGFAVLEAVGAERVPAVVFVTAYDRYALRAFDVHALDYLLKPFDRERFRKALARARTQIGERRDGALGARLLALLKDIKQEPKYRDRFVIKSAGRVLFLRADEIDWIEAAGNYVQLHIGSATHLMRDTMSGLEARLQPEKFVRIHRSTIVQVDRIKEMQPSFHGDYVVLLEDGTRLNLSRSYREKLQAVLGQSF
jgi:two-component system LytT family response regulator